MHAVIVSGGKQYPVAPGEVIRLEKLPEAEGSAVEFDQIALVANDDGQVTVGTPWVAGAREESRGRVLYCHIGGQAERKSERKRGRYRMALT